MNIIQQLHDSEINARISSFYDRCWKAELGDEINGFAANIHAETFEDAEEQLAKLAATQYPKSKFAASYQARHSPVTVDELAEAVRHLLSVYDCTHTTLSEHDTALIEDARFNVETALAKVEQ